MADLGTHHVQITAENPALSALEISWGWAEFSAEDGLGPLGSMYEAGDALVAVARSDEDGMTILGSGVMVAPGILLTATHVLQEFSPSSAGPLFLTFLPGQARAWLPFDIATISKQSEFDEDRKVYSDVSLVSCTLNSDALTEFPLGLATMQVALPLVGERLWAIGLPRRPYFRSGLFTIRLSAVPLHARTAIEMWICGCRNRSSSDMADAGRY